jgi:hypothetical protein
VRRIREWSLCCLCFGGAARELHDVLASDGQVNDDYDGNESNNKGKVHPITDHQGPRGGVDV